MNEKELLDELNKVIDAQANLMSKLFPNIPMRQQSKGTIEEKIYWTLDKQSGELIDIVVNSQVNV